MANEIRRIETVEPERLSRPQPFDGGAYYEEDEIHLIDYLIVLLRHKILIIGMVFVAGMGAVVLTSGRERVYRSEATIAPRAQESTKVRNSLSVKGLATMTDDEISFGGSSSQENIVTVLNSRKLAEVVIKTYKLMPILFPEDWDSDKNKWKTGDAPTLQDGIEAIHDMLQVDVPKNRKDIVTVSFVNKDPEMAKRLVSYYLTTLSESMREDVLRDTAENKRFLDKQLATARDPLMVEKIYALLASEIEKDTFTRGQKYFGFRILDPPIVPDLDKGESTHRKRACLLSVVVAFFLAVFLAFMIEYVRRFKAEDQERYKELVKELKVWKIKRG